MRPATTLAAKRTSTDGGGFVTQDMVLREPRLVRKLILAGTGPAGGDGIDKVGAVPWPLVAKARLTFKEPQFYLFLSSTSDGRRAASAFLQRLKERKLECDKAMTWKTFLRQLKAIRAWGRRAPQNLGAIKQPVLVRHPSRDHSGGSSSRGACPCG